MTQYARLPDRGDTRRYFEPVTETLCEVETLIQRQLALEEPHLAPAAQHTRETGGKRLRPASFLLLSKLLGERPGLPHVVVAAVLELCHTASLLHDDVLDHARRRRGRPSLNAFRGNRETILFGDVILAGAFQLLADLARPELVAVMANLVREVCSGEIRQWAKKSFDLSEEDYLAIVRSKTASFFRFAGTLAGRMASLGKAHTERLETWGDCFGTAYQIADDLYDLLSPAQADKSTGQDARAGVLTLPWIRLRDRHGKRALRERYLASQSTDMAELQDDGPLRDAIADSARVADQLLSQGQKQLRNFPASDSRRALLRFGGDLKGKIKQLITAPTGQ